MATPPVITVSQLRAACLDADWRQRWRAGLNPPVPMKPNASEFPVQGPLFHTLARRFTDWLTTDAIADTVQSGADLWKELYDRFAVAELDRLLAEGKIPSAHHLSRALEAFCHRLAELRTAAGAEFRNWRDLFLTHEYDLHQVRVETARGPFLISGRPDAVRQAPGKGIEIVDYKLSRGSSVKEDLIQIAAYAHLLRVAKPGLRFSGVLEYYEPMLHVTEARESDLEALWRDVICPSLEDLLRGEAGEPSLITESAPRPAEAQPAADEMAAAIERTYASFGLNVRVLGKTSAPQLIRYQVQPGDGVKVVSLANRAEDLQVALRLKSTPLIQAAPGCVTIDLPKESPETVLWKSAAAEVSGDQPAMQFPVGVGVDGQVVTADFSDPNTCHALVAGVAGSGKSEFLKSMVASLIAKNPPENLRLFLIDPKAVTFAPLAQCRHLGRPIMTDLAATLPFLDEAVAEMDRRYPMLAAGGHENIAHRGADAIMPYWLIVFDEFADLILAGRKEKQAFESLVARLAQKGRAAGIHLVLATQRPDAKVVSGLIKSNLPLKVCLRVTSAINSQIVLDAPGAEALLGRGDLLCDRGRGAERAQSLYVSAEQLREICG